MTFSNDLNGFFARFDVRNESTELQDIIEELRGKQCTPPTVSVDEVAKRFAKQKARKAPGPDGLSAQVIKGCALQLAPIFTVLFNRSLSLSIVPSCWKESTLVPLPKNNIPQIRNDLRPVALTDLVMKHLERSVGSIMKPQSAGYRDNLQFAYSDNLGVEDAILTLLDTIYCHLDKPRTYTRACFIDFSSAFNC